MKVRTSLLLSVDLLEELEALAKRWDNSSAQLIKDWLRIHAENFEQTATYIEELENPLPWACAKRPFTLRINKDLLERARIFALFIKQPFSDVVHTIIDHELAKVRARGY